jgi:dipeptidyl aminopeptidase/acylaminoacyl peptidase
MPVLSLMALLALTASMPSSAKELSVAELEKIGAAGSHFQQVHLSPEGSRLAWTEEVLGKDGLPDGRGALLTAELNGPFHAAPVPVADGAVREPRWSPDGKRLAFVIDPPRHAAHGMTEVRVVEGGKPPRRVAQFDAALHDLRWSPDGRELAVLSVPGRSGHTGAVEATRPDAGVVGESPEHAEIRVIDPASGKSEAVSPAGLYVYEYDWSPDGKHFVATAAPDPGEANYWVAGLVLLSRTPGTPQVLLKPTYQIANPRFTADGSGVLLIGGLMSDQGSTGGDLYYLALSGGEARNLTAGQPFSVTSFDVAKSGAILCVENIDGGTRVESVDAGSGARQQLWHADAVLHGRQGLSVSMTADGSHMAAIHQSFSEPAELWAGTFDNFRPLTSEQSAVKPVWGKATNLHWKTDAGVVQGWLLAPPDPLPAGKSPLIVLVHGGPASSLRASWPAGAGALANRGFYVLMPNPRGSYGSGEEFTRGNVKDFGYGDLRDIMAGVDQAIASAPIDPNRLGLYGWSYGGYMAMWAVTQTHRFRAVVAGAGIMNWQSYYGENGIDTWMIPYFGSSVYDDPWIYERSSPITFIKNVQTPTLVLQGERDAEVPAPQAYEFWHALKTMGVETQLVIYPGSGHRLLPDADHDRTERTLAWFKDHMGAESSTPTPAPKP